MGSLKCLQINLQHNSAAAADLSQLILDLNIDIILVQEPYCNHSSHKLTNVSLDYKAFHFPSIDFQYGSAIILKSNLIVKPILDICSNEVTSLKFLSNNTEVYFLSVYFRPLLPNLGKVMSPFSLNKNIQLSNVIICMDSNAHDPLWNSSFTDQKGTELLEIITEKNLIIANTL